jgi:hypothetical protein
LLIPPNKAQVEKARTSPLVLKHQAYSTKHKI